MKSHGKSQVIHKFFSSLYINGPLGTLWRISNAAQTRFDKIPLCKNMCQSFHNALYAIQVFLDSGFDKIHGTDTSGVIPLKDLEINSGNIKDCNWYGPMPVKVFKKIIKNLTLDFHKYEFIDFGSGKGRVLLLASDYGFKKIVGVEFAPELHRISNRNIAIIERDTNKPSAIETLCMGATEYVIPEVPVVLFFYSPFKGQVMQCVLRSILNSFATRPRNIMIIFYGANSESIELLKATNWPYRELAIRADWSRFYKMRSLVFTSPKSN